MGRLLQCSCINRGYYLTGENNSKPELVVYVWCYQHTTLPPFCLLSGPFGCRLTSAKFEGKYALFKQGRLALHTCGLTLITVSLRQQMPMWPCHCRHS